MARPCAALRPLLNFLVMIRSFDLRDLALVHRLSEQGVLLHAEVALTSSPHPLRSALINMLLGGQYATYVWKSGEGNAAFAQLDWDAGLPSAQVVCLGAEANDDPDSIDETIWLPFLEQLIVEAGRRGVHNLVAEVGETGPELTLLRRAGFAVYTRQDIWRCDELTTGRQATVELRPPQSVDEWDIQLLYVNIVPRLIQMVEPNPPTEPDHSWILREEGELVAFVHINDGAVADWMRLWIHPNVQAQAEAIIEAALLMKPPTPQHPIYCCVRRYQSWLRSPLENAGFSYWGSHAVMVKHIVQAVGTEEARAVTRAAQPNLLEPQTFSSPAPVKQRSQRLVHDGRNS